ncbi:uncharacterized protein LOC120667307 [Panicum virgatum]|uniref:Uncharacterized protein n=1 Tax=Panicum virgatum TaxID=38727 RepID=A0A8T0U6E5_PANVG|nr:uncharacterized protein LOC120667307 [Panicum virgatum]KAG2616622.1 hypothetical protein PVAP13_3NG248968 [Panicum virgatum]KAG2616623.1 hypothetical protein PVAP13_3NG248968 [Panicum virgatum]
MPQPKLRDKGTGSIGGTGPAGEIPLANLSSGGSSRKHQAVAGSIAGTPPRHQAATSSSAAAATPRKHQAVTGSSAGTPRKRQVVAGSSGEMPRKNRMEEKAGVALSGEMSQKSYKKETTKPSPQLRHHPSGTQRARPITDLPATRGKKHSERNASAVPRKPLLTGQKPRRTSSNPGNTTAKDRKESTASRNERWTEEIIRNIHEVDYAIQELNELGLGEDISYEEFEGYLQLLPCKSPEVDTSILLNQTMSSSMNCKSARYCIASNIASSHDKAARIMRCIILSWKMTTHCIFLRRNLSALRKM